jgi:hypothetical protein
VENILLTFLFPIGTKKKSQTTTYGWRDNTSYTTKYGAPTHTYVTFLH